MRILDVRENGGMSPDMGCIRSARGQVIQRLEQSTHDNLSYEDIVVFVHKHQITHVMDFDLFAEDNYETVDLEQDRMKTEVTPYPVEWWLKWIKEQFLAEQELGLLLGRGAQGRAPGEKA